MSQTFAPEVAGAGTIPTNAANGGLQGGRVRRFRATIPYAGQTSGSTIVLADVPAGSTFMYGVINATATAGATATIAIGNATSATKYRGAVTFTTSDTPTLFAPAAVVAAAPSDAPERVIATIGAASLPNSANYAVVDLYFSAP